MSRETYTTSQKNETIGAIAEKLDLPAGDLVKINKPFYGRITAKTKFKTQTVLYLSARAAEAGTAPPPSGRELAAKAAAASTVPNSFPNGDDYIATLVSPDHSAEFALFVMLGDMCSSCEDGNTSPRVTGDSVAYDAAAATATISACEPRSIPCGRAVARVSFNGVFPLPRRLLPLECGGGEGGGGSPDSTGDWSVPDAAGFDVYVLFAGQPVGNVVSVTPTLLVVDVALPHSPNRHYLGRCPVTPVVNGVRGATFNNFIVRALNFSPTKRRKGQR